MPGDGIGPEVMAVALDVMYAMAKLHAIDCDVIEADLGGIAIERFGTPLPDTTLESARAADAVLVGAVGGPKWDGLPFHENPGGGGLLRLRHELDLYANLRPVRTVGHSGQHIDLLIVREATGGLYFGRRGSTGTGEQRSAFDTMAYSAPQIRRVLERACGFASERGGRITSVDKANVLASSRLWRDVAEEVFELHLDLDSDHLHVDNCAAQLVIAPEQFDVIVTENLFGDILSDQAAALEGSLGFAASANLGEGSAALYEPVHGSAPDIAGQGIANPSAAIRSVALMFRYSLGRPDLASQLDSALETVLASGAVTADVAGRSGASFTTGAFGALVLEELHSSARGEKA